MVSHTQKIIYDSEGRFDGTEDSRDLVLRMKEKYKNVLLCFSRGKDSLCAWLYMRHLGIENIVPYTLITIPGLSFVEKSITYFEEVFDTPIRQYMNGETYLNLNQLFYQPLEDQEFIASKGFWEFYCIAVAQLLSQELEYKEGEWILARGISMYDTLNRIKWVHNLRGFRSSPPFVIEEFFPCWDWKPSQIREFIKKKGVSLTLDYTLDKTDMTDVPLLSTLVNMKRKYPEDFERVKLYYPFIEARIARNEFRKKREAKLKAEKESTNVTRKADEGKLRKRLAPR